MEDSRLRIASLPGGYDKPGARVPLTCTVDAEADCLDKSLLCKASSHCNWWTTYCIRATDKV